MTDDAPVEDRSSRTFAASIRTYVDQELLVTRVDDGWEVRAGDEALGWVGNPRASADAGCVTRDGGWQFTRLRGGDVEATMGTAVVGRYESRLLPGGTIVLPDDSRFRLRASVTGETWRLRRGRRALVLDVRPMRVGWAIRLRPAAGELQQLPLIAMLTFHVVLSEIDRPTGGVADAGSPYVGF